MVLRQITQMSSSLFVCCNTEQIVQAGELCEYSAAKFELQTDKDIEGE